MNIGVIISWWEPRHTVSTFTMLLTIDIGNTNITCGVFEVDGSTCGYVPMARWRIATEPGRQPDEYGLILTELLAREGVGHDELTAVALCSVVPPLTVSFSELCASYFSLTPLVVGAGVKTGVRILYDSPRDVGADRIADAAAALKLYGGPAVIVDFGTATVFDAISGSGEYVGGAIAPGMTVAADALFHRSSMLRRVELERPSSAIGKNTVHALQSGLILGYADLVKGMVERFDRELGGGATVVATGGLADLIEPETECFDVVNQDLTLAGLKIIYHLNV